MQFMTRWTRSLSVAGAAAALVACGAPRPQGGALAASAESREPVKAAALGRAELWGLHCARCHNLRPRAEYSPAQWAVVVNHMRVVADMPGEDYRALLEYLADRQPATKITPSPRGEDRGSGSP